MTSLSMRAVALFLRSTSAPHFTSPERARRQMQAPKGSSDPPARLRRRHAVSSRRVEGFECWTVAPGAGGAARAAVYLHGGAYTNEIVRQHWALVSRLADAGLRVEVPIYGLAPLHTHHDAHPFVTAVYRELLADVDASRVSLAGDSAGGGLALGLAQTLGASGLPQPRRIVLVSPWLDIALRNPQIPAVEARDPWLRRAGLLEMGRAWAGGTDPDDARLSPVRGALAGLAPVRAWVGTRDLALPDVLLLRERAAAEGADVQVTVCDGALHVPPLLPTPEGRAAARAVVQELAA